MPILMLLLMTLPVADLVSGPQPGRKLGPYTFLLSTGEHRGTSHCYVCETGNDPAVIILARSNSVPLGKFINQLEKQMDKPSKPELRAWVTFVGMDQPKKEPELIKWSKQTGIRKIPVGIFEGSSGPPGYKLHAEADFTILLVRQGKVVHNFAFGAGKFSEAQGKEILSRIPDILK